MMQCRNFHTAGRLGLILALAAVVTGAMAQGQESTSSSGAVRLARFSYIEGKVLWRPDSTTEWSEATSNLPIRQGSQISTSDDARAEIQFDDGSTLRMTSGAVLTLDNLYSDADGEFTELKLNDGTASMHLKTQFSIYQIDTPDGSVKSSGPAKVRLDASSHLKVAVQEGRATLDTPAGEYKLHVGDFSQVSSSNVAPDILDLPGSDDFDQFCDSRDASMTVSDNHMPSEVSLVAGDIDSYGTWHTDPAYGSVWCPRVHTAGWRPYHDGRWVWVEPFGWTWVSNEPWGWAPYHYGTWVYESYGWAWVPGPRHQCWSPAVVSFTSVGNCTTWVPLAPCEVHYTTVAFGFGHGDWSLYFSIGGCGSYYAGGHDYCVARPWNNRYLNHDVYVHQTNITHITNVYNSTTVIDHRFRPHNALYSGATQATTEDFRRGHGYVPLGRDAMKTFEHGQTIVAGGDRLYSGPANVRPTVGSISPNPTYRPGTIRIPGLDRPVFRPVTIQIPGLDRTAGNNRVDPGQNSGRGQSSPPRYPRDNSVTPGRTSNTGGAIDPGISSGRGQTKSPRYPRDNSVTPGTTSNPGRVFVDPPTQRRDNRTPSPAELAAQARAALGTSDRSNPGGRGNRGPNDKSNSNPGRSYRDDSARNVGGNPQTGRSNGPVNPDSLRVSPTGIRSGNQTRDNSQPRDYTRQNRQDPPRQQTRSDQPRQPRNDPPRRDPPRENRNDDHKKKGG